MISELPTQRGRSRSRSRERIQEYPKDRTIRDVSYRGVDEEPSRARSKSPVVRGGQDPGKERRRPTWFDIQPVAGAPPPISDLPGAVQVTPENASGNLVSSSQSGVANQQATRHARRIYVRGQPAHTKEGDIATFFRYDNFNIICTTQITVTLEIMV